MLSTTQEWMENVSDAMCNKALYAAYCKSESRPSDAEVRVQRYLVGHSTTQANASLTGLEVALVIVFFRLASTKRYSHDLRELEFFFDQYYRASTLSGVNVAVVPLRR